MVHIIIGQRDRFKSRIQELETQAAKFGKQLESKVTEIESLRADNIKLYEKIKYLESYGDFSKSNKRGGSFDIEAFDGELDVRYKKLYEDTVNPFTLFNKKEKDKQYNKLNAADRMTLTTGRFFLSNPVSRTFLFFYTIALHVLVLFTLYRLSTESQAVCISPTLDVIATNILK